MNTPQDAVEMSSAEDAGRSSAESNASVLEVSEEKIKISKNHVAVAVDEQQPPYLAAYRQPSKGPSTFQMHGMTVTLQDVTYAVQIPDKENSKLFRKKKVDKTLLDGITCSFVPNRLVALMGSSGAGKTTLMDLVAGRKNQGTVDGDMLFDGKPRPSYFKRVAGYVEQNDVLIPTLTVRETLLYAAELRLPADQYTTQEKAERVDQIIETLGLTHCADTQVGDNLQRGVSGGERKRVCIGQELVTSPRILFLDEPTRHVNGDQALACCRLNGQQGVDGVRFTCGLDSATTLDVVRVLKNLARNGQTVVCTIHQPSSSAFALFDQLVLLRKGRLVYNGPASEAEKYFRSLGFDSTETVGFNPADFVLAVGGGGTGHSEKTITGNFTLDLADQWAKTNIQSARNESTMRRVENLGIESVNAKDLPTANSRFHELKTLMSRSWLCATRDPNFMMLHIGKNVIIALILVSIFYNVNDTETYPNINALALLFMVVTQWSMNGIAYLSPLIQDRQVFYRERSAGAYRVGPYYWQRVLIELPFTIVSSVIFTLIVWFGCGYPTDAGKYFIFLLVVFLCGETASAFAHCLSALSPTVEVATAIAPMILIVMMLFSGFLLTTSKIPVYWQYTVRYLSWIAYAFQALGNSTFTGTPNEMVIPMYELDQYSVWTNIGCLIAMLAMWRIGGMLAIKYISFYKR